MIRRIAVVLLNLGGPLHPEDVRPFLLNLFSDPAIIAAPSFIRRYIARAIVAKRGTQSVANYAQLGGGSPLLAETEAQAEELMQALITGTADTNESVTWKVFIGMRYWHPFIPECVGQLAEWQATEVIVVPLYPQCSTTTTHSSVRLLLQEMAKIYRPSKDNPNVPSMPFMSVVGCYPRLHGFVDHFAQAIVSGLHAQPADAQPLIVFSAHGLPQRTVDRGDPYVAHVHQTCAAILAQVSILLAEADPPAQTSGIGWQPHTYPPVASATPPKNVPENVPESAVCFQSRVGPMKWIEPYTDAFIAEHSGGRDAIVVPVAFVSEHIETLLELDHELRELAENAGCRSYTRIATPRASAQFCAGLADLVFELAGITSPPTEALEADYRPIETHLPSVRYFSAYDACAAAKQGADFVCLCKNGVGIEDDLFAN